MGSNVWGRAIAEAYDSTSASMFDPAVLDPAVDLLAEVAGGGPALELAIGTGRVALPLSARGPSELDLMARCTGLRLRDRWSGWDRSPFTAESTTQVAVFEKPAG